MTLTTRTRALIGAVAVATVPAAVLVASPAQADVDRRGSIDGGVYEFSVDREGKRYEVQAELDRVTPRSTWTIVMRHNGKRFVKTNVTADREGDLDVERLRPNTNGSDTFRFIARRTDGSAKVSRSITVG